MRCWKRHGLGWLTAMGLALSVVLSGAGCRTTIGDKQLILRPGISVPPGRVDQGDGTLMYVEHWVPPGETYLLVLGLRDKQPGDRDTLERVSDLVP